MTPRRILPAVAALLGLLAAACGGGGGDGQPAAGSSPTPTGEGGTGLTVQVASYDVAVSPEARLIAGLLTPSNRLIGGGEATMSFAYLGEQGASGQPEPGPTTTAHFLPLPGKEPGQELTRPTVLQGDAGVGVYETTVALDRPGFWQVTVQAEVDGSTRQGSGAFQVLPEHLVPAVGDQALATQNLTMDSEAPEVAIDSRAGSDGEVPDPELHSTTVAQALEAGRPVVLVISTPVYCVSRFCGPITETVQELAGIYGDRAAFVHVEVWRDFQSKEMNPAAAEWIQTEQGGTEPWVFLIGGDGTITARWDNVLDEAELTSLLEGLPAV